MAKKRKKAKKKKSKYERTCIRCGNDVFSIKEIYKCPFCGMENGRSY